MIRPAPDFVIAGGPKCGTTAIYRTLQEHPDLFLPAIKEPHYFAFQEAHHRAVESSEVYDRLFTDARESQLRGEASVMYLSSPGAISAILDRRPDARIIAVVRNPVELFVSWHNQCLKNLDEDIEDPEQAWRLQDRRALGLGIPKSCHEPRSLLYRHVCSLGSQIERLFELVPEDQRLILVFDDLKRDPGEVYKRILEFLGVMDDGRRTFFRENEFGRPRSIMIARLSRAVRKYRLLKTVRLRLKPFLNRHGIYWIERLFSNNLNPSAKPTLSEAFEYELMAEFLPDTRRLEKLLGRNFSEWQEASADRQFPPLVRKHGI